MSHLKKKIGTVFFAGALCFTSFAGTSSAASNDESTGDLTEEQILELDQEWEESIENWSNDIDYSDEDLQEIAENKGVDIPIQTEQGSQSLMATMAASSFNPTYGDVLVTQDSGISSFRWGHAAIVRTDNRYTIEAYSGDGVQSRSISKWKDPKKVNTVKALWVNKASGTSYTGAAKYVAAQVGKPYNKIFTDSKTTSKFYCSQLAWRAWYNQGFDINGGSDSIITPWDLYQSKNTSAYYSRGY